MTPAGTESPFSFLAEGESLTLHDLEWACQHLVVEVSAPPASADLMTPAQLSDRARYLRRTGRAEEARVLRQQAQKLPTCALDDPGLQATEVHPLRG